MRFSTIVGIFTVMLTLVTGWVLAEHVIDDSKNTGYLFVITGTSGSLDGDSLTLNGVPNVIFFSDRPVLERTRTMSLGEFRGMWNNGQDSFKADPPNATLSVLNKGLSKALAEAWEFELTSEILMNNNTIRFKVDVLNGARPTAFFLTAALYIDFKYPPFGGGHARFPSSLAP